MWLLVIRYSLLVIRYSLLVIRYSTSENANYRIIELSNYRVIELSNYRVIELSSYRIIELSNYRITGHHLTNPQTTLRAFCCFRVWFFLLLTPPRFLGVGGQGQQGQF